MGDMNKVEQWPPPDWTEVVITWNDMLKRKNVQEIIKWVEEAPGGRFHLHGWKSTEGFAYRFEDPKDAIIFAMKWS
jgi:hypothetical protein